MLFRSCSTCRCISDVFVGRKVISTSYSSPILKQGWGFVFKAIQCAFSVPHQGLPHPRSFLLPPGDSDSPGFCFAKVCASEGNVLSFKRRQEGGGKCVASKSLKILKLSEDFRTSLKTRRERKVLRFMVVGTSVWPWKVLQEGRSISEE